MSIETDTVSRLRTLSDDLLDLDIAMERQGHRGHNTYGRLVNYAGNLLVLAKSYGPQMVVVEFVKPDLPEDSTRRPSSIYACRHG